MRLSLALIALYLLALPAPAPANPPTVSDLREGDQATWNGTALSFSSAIGIGQATLTPSGKWPEKVTLRFLYTGGRGMNRIEYLEVVSGEQRAVFRFPDPSPEESPLRPQNGALELDLSETWLQEGQPLTVRWIDLYR